MSYVACAEAFVGENNEIVIPVGQVTVAPAMFVNSRAMFEVPTPPEAPAMTML